MEEFKIKNVSFLKSCSTFAQTLEVPPLSSFAFVGRSNVGKSSLLNMLTNRKDIAKVSKTPGRTRLLNFFKLDGYENSVYFVDLPGYGFAAASKQIQGGWDEEISRFLSECDTLRQVFLLLDIRHAPSALDIAALHFLQSSEIAFTIVATKADKFSRSAANTAAMKLAGTLGLTKNDIIVTSSEKGIGRGDIMAKVATYS